MRLEVLDRYRDDLRVGLLHALRGDDEGRRAARVDLGLETPQGTLIDAMEPPMASSLLLFVAEDLGTHLAAALPASIAVHLLFHASRIHADIEDHRAQRRGRPTVWSRIGVAGAIHAGDLMLPLAWQEALRAPPEVFPCLLDAWRDTLDGRSLRQSMRTRQLTASEYRAMIQLDPAATFRSAFEIGGIVAEAPMETVRRLASFGEGVGMAWAIRDDLLKVWGDGDNAPTSSGEVRETPPVGYPWIAAHDAGSEADRRVLEQAVKGNFTTVDMDRLLAVFERLAIRAETEDRIREHLQEAVEHLPYVPFSEPALETLTQLFDQLTDFGDVVDH